MKITALGLSLLVVLGTVGCAGPGNGQSGPGQGTPLSRNENLSSDRDLIAYLAVGGIT